MSIRILIFALLGLISCKTDDFYNVTKTVKAPEIIEIDTPFKFNLILTNNTKKPLPLTLDKEITKSIQFLPNWYCGDRYLIDETPNPKSKNHDYYSVELKPNDSLVFDLVAELRSYSNGDSLLLSIDDYEKNFKLAHPRCEHFYLNFGGMWIPGNGPFGDSMEGYNFKTNIKIRNDFQINKSSNR